MRSQRYDSAIVTTEDNQPPNDVRRHPRVPIELRVEYRKLNAFFADYTQNISRGGTFIQTSSPLPVGSRFLFKMTIPTQSESVDVMGEVVWSRTDVEVPGMGIQFVYGSERQRVEFEALVLSLMTDSLGEHVAQRLVKKSKSP